MSDRRPDQRPEGRSQGELLAMRTSAGYELGRDEERARIRGILELSTPGYERETDDAIAGGTQPDAFAAVILRVQRDRGTTLDQQRADATGVGHGGVAAADGDPKAGWAKAASKFRAEHHAAAAKNQESNASR